MIAEIGIDHNGDVDLAKKLISVPVSAAPIFEQCSATFDHHSAFESYKELLAQ